jgi:hypothetical protein
MQEDPAYVKLVEKSFIMKNYHRSHPRAEVPQVRKEPTILHKVITTGFLSSLIHIVAFPLDTIKVRKMARSKLHDVARFEQNKVANLTPYLGFFKGYLSIMIGNMCFLTLGQHNFMLGVVGEGLFKTWIDISKISTQMGNESMKMEIVKKVFPIAASYAVLRDLVSRGSYMLLADQIIQRNQIWLQQDLNRRYHIYFFSAIVATIVSHPFDVIFTRIASQRSIKYTGLLQTPLTILKEEKWGKMASGLDYRLFYNLVSIIIMGNSYDKLMQMTLEVL